MTKQRLTKREKRRNKAQSRDGGSTPQQNQEQPQRGLHLKEVKPLTENQEKAFTSYFQENNLVLHGVAGTGKTYLGFYLGLSDVLDRDLEEIDKLVVVRSAVQTRNQGFLPGKIEEKAAGYEEPYKAICTELFNRGDAYEILKQKKQLEFVTTSFIRGVTLNNSIVLVDEMQNMNAMELHSIMTRIGKDSRIMFSGDYRQTDLHNPHDPSGINQFLFILDNMNGFDRIEFETHDIVRSGIVKEYLETRLKLGIE